MSQTDNPATARGQSGRSQQGGVRNQDRPLFSLSLTAMLTDVGPERLRQWQEAGLVGRHKSGLGSLQRSYSIRDLHAIDTLREVVEHELDERAHQLQAAHQAKSDFMRLVAHELRAPMAVVRGYVSLISDGSLGQMPNSLMDILPLMGVRLAEMDRLANQMLEVARFEDGRMLLEMRRLDLRGIVSDAIQSVTFMAGPDHEFRVVLPSWEVPVVGDQARLLMILTNLLSNALKYSPAGGAVECTTIISGSRSRVSVRDEGIGIAKEDHPRLFRLFGRLQGEEVAGIGGTGLGLYISRVLAQRHGGDITVESEVGQGSQFTLDLPCASAASALEARETELG